MRTLYLDCGMGAAGDMMMGALLELLPEPEQFLERLNHAGIPGVQVQRVADSKCGICGTHMRVLVQGEEEGHHGHEHHHQEHSHGHEHHEHGHSHASMEEIGQMIQNLHVSEQVKRDVTAIYGLVAEAEGKVHGKPVTEVHFHEMGMMDAVADITGCAMLMEELGAERVVASPVRTGHGTVRCAHGILPVPAPATAELLTGIPCYGGEIEGELCTPTGAAILKYYVQEFSGMPPMTIQKVGYGTGMKEFAAANVVRAALGETAEEVDPRQEQALGGQTDVVLELSCSLDDMTGEDIGYACELLLEQGALEVYTAPVMMKKSRPGNLLTVLCREEDREKMAGLLFAHTTTIGIREKRCRRMMLERREKLAEISEGSIRIKESSGYGVVKSKPEYEDVKKAAKQADVPLAEIRKSLI